MNHWPFVLGAYALAAVVLLGYWGRVERRLRRIEGHRKDRRAP